MPALAAALRAMAIDNAAQCTRRLEAHTFAQAFAAMNFSHTTYPQIIW